VYGARLDRRFKDIEFDETTKGRVLLTWNDTESDEIDKYTVKELVRCSRICTISIINRLHLYSSIGGARSLSTRDSEDSRRWDTTTSLREGDRFRGVNESKWKDTRSWCREESNHIIREEFEALKR